MELSTSFLHELYGYGYGFGSDSKQFYRVCTEILIAQFDINLHIILQQFEQFQHRKCC